MVVAYPLGDGVRGEGHASPGAGRLSLSEIHSPHAACHAPAAGAWAEARGFIILVLYRPAKGVRPRRSQADVGDNRPFRSIRQDGRRHPTVQRRHARKLGLVQRGGRVYSKGMYLRRYCSTSCSLWY